jgi:hypothetical protein
MSSENTSSNASRATSAKALPLGEAGEPVKFICVTGGVISGIGKGVIASSIGSVLKACGVRVTCIKIDPYLNIGQNPCFCERSHRYLCFRFVCHQ